MKQCPVCKSIVDSESECPICGNTITYEPPVMADKELIPWNKNTVLYYLKNTWFSVLSCLTGAFICIMATPKMDYLFFLAVFCAIVSLFVSFFHRKLAKYMTWKYSEEYVPYKLGLLKYTTGGIAILFFMLTGFICNS